MPTYSYSCPACGTEFDHVCPMADYQSVRPCVACENSALRIFRPETAPRPSFFKPYVTPHINGEPVEVSSPRQEQDLCRAHGLVVTGGSEQYKTTKPVPEVFKRSIEEDYHRELQKGYSQP